MFICSMTVLLLALHNSDGYKFQNKDARITCEKGEKLVGYQLRKIFLKAHNEGRALLAEGKVTTETLGKLPAAANMRFMEYDCDLEEKAIDLVSTHRRLENRTGFTETDENFATIESHNRGSNKVAEQAVSDWWNRKSEWRSLKNITSDEYKAIPFFLMAQAETDKVGCAVKYYMDDSKFYYNLACFYGKEIKVGSELYQQSTTACTNCTQGYECDQKALCKKQSNN